MSDKIRKIWGGKRRGEGERVQLRRGVFLMIVFFFVVSTITYPKMGSAHKSRPKAFYFFSR